MATPQFIEESPIGLTSAKEILQKIEKRDTDLNYRSHKAKEYLDNFAKLSEKKEAELNKKLVDLSLTRLKQEHIIKLIDLLPVSINELKAALQAYPLSLPKKDQEAIIGAIKDFKP